MSENGNIHRQSAEALLGELDNYCSSDLLSEGGLRELFERHGLTPNNNNIGNINYDFFDACYNERVTEGIIRCLIEYFPDAAGGTTQHGWTPLHYACYNKSMTRGIIQLLIDAAPDSVGSVNNDGTMPLHVLCGNNRMKETASIQLLKFLIELCPEAVRHVSNNGYLPIHIAASWSKSPDFCRVLIEAYPGSERIANAHGILPLHRACAQNTVATVQYLYKLYPDAVNHESTNGLYPIHSAIKGMSQQANPESGIETVQFLMDCEPNVIFQKRRGMSLLDWACEQEYDDSNIDAALDVIKVIYDAHPEAIEGNRIASNIQRYHQQVQAFIRSELVYARQAKDHRLMTTPDGNGRLPLHNAIQNNVRLGSIKLLVKGSPTALQSTDNGGALPLHIACERHNSANVIQYLVGLDTSTLTAVDNDGDTALHYACGGARYGTIATLLDKYDAASVSRRNAHNKLPIDLLWESDEVEDRESVEYTESVFRLLKSYPETHLNDSAKLEANTGGSSTENKKKRKLGAV